MIIIIINIIIIIIIIIMRIKGNMTMWNITKKVLN